MLDLPLDELMESDQICPKCGKKCLQVNYGVTGIFYALRVDHHRYACPSCGHRFNQDETVEI